MARLRTWMRIGAYIEVDVPENAIEEEMAEALKKKIISLKTTGFEPNGESYTPSDIISSEEVTLNGKPIFNDVGDDLFNINI